MPNDKKKPMRAEHPEFAGFVDGLRKAFGEPHAVTFGGVRYGKPEMWFRREQQHQPPIPGVYSNGYSDSRVRGGQSGVRARKNRGVSRPGSRRGDEAPEGARAWWTADDDGDEAGSDV